MKNSGITVYNDNNKLVLNDTYKNFYVSRKIELTGTGTTSGTFRDGEYIAAVGGLTDTTIDAYCSNGPKGWTCEVKTFKKGLFVYVLSINIPTREHGEGIQIFDSKGKLIFDSAMEPAIILGCGHNETELPTSAERKYALATGAPTVEKGQDVKYDQHVSYDTKYHPEETHRQYVPEKSHTELVSVPEKGHYEYDTSKEPWTMKWVVDVPAHNETKKVIDEPAHWETVVDKKAWTEYITSWETWVYYHYWENKHNFGIKDKKIQIIQLSNHEKTKMTTDVWGKGTESSDKPFPVPSAPSGYDTYNLYTVNPTSFLLIDVTNL